VLLSLVVFVVHLRGVTTTCDSRWTVHTALSILHEGDIDLDEYTSVIRADDHRVHTTNGHLYPVYPVGTPLLSLPFVALAERLWTPSSDLHLYEHLQRYSYDERPLELMLVEVAIACTWVAITTVLIYILAGWYLSRGLALWVAIRVAFATPAWSTASRALWAHTPTMLLLTITLGLFVAAKKRPGLIQCAGLPLAFSFVVRPTNGMSVVVLTLWVWMPHRRYFWPFILGALVVAVPFVWFNLSP